MPGNEENLNKFRLLNMFTLLLNYNKKVGEYEIVPKKET
jgi:hypothetical protein